MECRPRQVNLYSMYTYCSVMTFHVPDKDCFSNFQSFFVDLVFILCRFVVTFVMYHYEINLILYCCHYFYLEYTCVFGCVFNVIFHFYCIHRWISWRNWRRFRHPTQGHNGFLKLQAATHYCYMTEMGGYSLIAE